MGGGWRRREELECKNSHKGQVHAKEGPKLPVYLVSAQFLPTPRNVGCGRSHGGVERSSMGWSRSRGLAYFCGASADALTVVVVVVVQPACGVVPICTVQRQSCTPPQHPRAHHQLHHEHHQYGVRTQDVTRTRL